MGDAFHEPLTARDAWFLYAERPEAPLDVATVYVFEGGSRFVGGRGAEGIEETIRERLHLVPRYRQKVHMVPLSIGLPVWVDDPDFDLSYHIRRELLPPPGEGAALRALVSRILSRPLDKRHPLWELTIVTGLRGGKVVLVNRAHHAMLDGMSNVDIATLLLDADPQGYTPEPPTEPWRARPAPSDRELIRRELWHPLQDAGGQGEWGLRKLARGVRLPWSGLFSIASSMVRPAPDLFFNRRLGLQRTGRGIKVPLESFKALKGRYGCTVNDAVLAAVAEGLNRWLRGRGDTVPERVRVFCPVSVRTDDDRVGGNRVSGMVFELPTGDIEVAERLRRISYTTGDLKKTRQAVAADKLTSMAEWAPPSLLLLAGRLMSTQQAGAKLNITNVPGPQFPLYTGGAQLLEVWPFAPLYPGMGLGVALVSYNGHVHFGLSADPAIVPDVEEFRNHLLAAVDACTALAGADPSS